MTCETVSLSPLPTLDTLTGLPLGLQVMPKSLCRLVSKVQRSLLIALASNPSEMTRRELVLRKGVASVVLFA